MNIWDYEYKKNVRLETKDGKVYNGTVIDIMDTDEMDTKEPMVDIETSEGIFGIWESEIKSIGISDKEVK